MNPTHTPGPWHLEYMMPSGDDPHWAVLDPHGKFILTTDGCDALNDLKGNDKANAALAAAAPDLLEALRLAFDCLDFEFTTDRHGCKARFTLTQFSEHGTIVKIRAAIAKAEGRA